MIARVTIPLSAKAVAPSAKLQRPNGTHADRPDDGVTGNPEALLRQIMALGHVGLLEVSCESLRLVSFTAPGTDNNAFGLDAIQTQAGTSWYENVYPPDRAKLRAHVNRNAEGGTRSRSFVEYRLIVGDGELLWVRHWNLGRLMPHKGNGMLRAALMAIPEQKHLEWECLRVSERECNRIGQELHDDLCQVLAGLTFMMRVVSQRAKQLDPTLAADIDELNTHVIGATERVRSMAHGLFPAQLNYSSLRDALTAYAAEARPLFRIQVFLELAPKLPSHNPEQIIQVYRIVQEAVSNAVRHGGATTVHIAVRRREHGLEVLIEDNGKGFPTASTRPEGIGLHVMEYRARALGGTLDFTNLSPRGVAVRLEYPIAYTTPRKTRNLLATP